MMADQGAVIVGFDSDQLNAAICKVQYLKCTGSFNQALKLGGDYLLWADYVINTQSFCNEGRVFGKILRRTDTRNLLWRMKQKCGSPAGNDICFITIGNCENQFGIVASRFSQDIRVRCMAMYRADVKTVLQQAQARLVDINEGNITTCLTRQYFGNGCAYLSGTKNDNFHVRRLFLGLISSALSLR
ncbi:hypothetical protein BMS3Bbin11_00135 [bacterium BMS3Bbin11]|nr:hypothetical protein BMS3Bbin11_00135 [bacterium BMS3Bbin11]